jgi:hypothetical protein
VMVIPPTYRGGGGVIHTTPRRTRVGTLHTQAEGSRTLQGMAPAHRTKGHCEGGRALRRAKESEALHTGG